MCMCVCVFVCVCVCKLKTIKLTVHFDGVVQYVCGPHAHWKACTHPLVHRMPVFAVCVCVCVCELCSALLFLRCKERKQERLLFVI